jgi:hypothetical protein
MPQAITVQQGTTSVTTATSSTNVNPTTLATAPAGGPSRVIITQFAVRAQTSSGATQPSELNCFLSVGTSATGYGYVGGFDCSNTPIGYVSLPQVMGTSAAGTGNGFSGTTSFYASEQCSFDPPGNTTTSKNLSADKLSLAAPGSAVTASMASQIWALPGDEIGVKLGGNIAVSCEVLYSFIFITES